MYFSAAASSENDHGSMNLASNTASAPSTMPANAAPIQGMAAGLHILDAPAGIALVPGAVEVLGGRPELHDEMAGEILPLGFAALLAPQANERRLVASHDDPG